MTNDVISVGVLTPHLAAGPEVELPEMAPGKVATQVARVSARDVATSIGAGPRMPGLRELATPRVLEDAAAAFAPGAIDVIGYASTTSAYAIGFDAETALAEQLSRRLGLPVTSACGAAVRALRKLQIQRIALVHPPWFDDSVNAAGAAYFTDEGFEVVSATSAQLPNDPRRIETGAIVEWVSQNLDADAEAIFIGGNGFRAAAAIAELETADGPVVLESNQVLLWSLLAQVGSAFEVHGYGRLFARRT